MTDPSIIGPASLALTQGIGAFTAFLPRLGEVRKADAKTDHEMVAEVRTGEIAAVALTVGVGAVASYLTKSNTPVTVSVVVAIGLVILYETTLRRDTPMNHTTGSETA